MAAFIGDSQHNVDGAIQKTDTDAALARLSAVQKGYLHDPYTRHLVSRAHLQPPRPPLINIGTYIRTTAIDDLVHQWITKAGKCQIISLGAGSDTRYFRIATSPLKVHISSYVEIDFPEVTARKAMAIRKSKELSAVLGSADAIRIINGGSILHAGSYHLFGFDLRSSPTQLINLLSAEVLSSSLPTLLLFECVLVYMSPETSKDLINCFMKYFVSSQAIVGVIVYEMFGLQDAFGKVMLANLQSRGVTLPGAQPYPTLDSLRKRFEMHNFSHSNALTLRRIRNSFIPHSELKRIAQLEMLDEIEELDLVLEHYAITWAVKRVSASDFSDIWQEWGLKNIPPLNTDLEDEAVVDTRI